MAPYKALTEKFGVEFDFKPFFLIEPLCAKEFRSQKIDLSCFTAIVFSSRHTIDAFFALCDEMRVKVPDTMKYFCLTELVANYLQKHIVYRKRKIFYGDGRPESIISQISPKHTAEKFLITTSDTSSAAGLASMFQEKALDYSVAVMVKSVPQDLTAINFNDYSMAVLYNPFDVKSLLANFPEFKQGKLKFLAYGKSIVKAMDDAGLSIEVKAPTPEAPSVASALELYLSSK